jgi:adenine deaminase
MHPLTFPLREETLTNLLAPYIVEGNIVDVFNRRIFGGRIHVNVFGLIEKIEETPVTSVNYIMPGFIDSHVHVESSMLMPSEFARAAVSHGVVAAVCDPHEIANILGIEGVEYFIENGKNSGFKFFFGAPSCVPATPFDVSGARLGAEETAKLLSDKQILFLAEMMNFPGVVAGDSEVMAKIEAAKNTGKQIDGHAPRLSGEALHKYVAAGISTDHECMDIGEAEEKLLAGMKILIREGSAAKNFDALYSLIDRYPDRVMLCTDDAHPDELKMRYINSLVSRGLSLGVNIFNLLQAASVNPVMHYGLTAGLLREGDFADFTVTDSVKPDFCVLKTFISGKLAYEKDERKISLHRPEIKIKNNFHAAKLCVDDIKIYIPDRDKNIRIIKIFNGELYTENTVGKPVAVNGEAVSSPETDVLKIVALNRYKPDAKPAVGFVSGFGLKQGALCSTVAHDSHNIIAVGADDKSIVEAINAVIDASGGIAVFSNGKVNILPLPIAGIISDKDIDTVSVSYSEINRLVKNLGSTLDAPFMTLAFMSLLVIPELKIGDGGLFDVNEFNYTELFV